jgi:capsular exopolysaccharide synthesis family protein
MIESKNTGNEIDIQKYFYLILARKWLFVAVAVGSFLLVTFYFHLKGPVYVARCDLSIENPGVWRNISIQEISDRKVELKTRLGHIKSQRLLQEVVEKLDLKKGLNVSSEEAAINAIQRSIYVYESEKNSNIITIEVVGKNPKLITDIANAAASAYVKQDAEDTLYISKKLDEWLALGSEISDWANISDDNIEIARAIESIPTVLKDEVLRNLKAQRIEIETERRKLSQYYLEKYPPLAFFNNELAAINKQIWERTSAILQSIRIGADEGLIPSTIRVLNYARVPTKPSKAEQNKMTILVVFFSVTALFLFLVIKGLADRTIKTEDDLTNIPFLGYVPSSEGPVNIRELSFKTREASSLIRTSINFAMPTGHEKCILVTSPLPGEGKTTVSAIVGTAMARAGKKTIIVGGDMRRSKIHEIFDLPNDLPGLSDYLKGEKTEKEVIINSYKQHLDLLPSGILTESSSDLLSSERMRFLIEKLKKEYDRIIIDAPPVMGISDSLLLSKFVDSVVLVTRFSKTGQAIFNHALNQLKGCGAPVIGVVINEFDATKMKHSPYKYYHSYYSYNLMQEDNSS